MNIQDITADIPRRMVRLTFNDGSIRELSIRDVRQACRCADCVMAKRRGEDLQLEDDLSLSAITPIGEYGLLIHFSDGHERGIYPLPYLVDLSKKLAS